MNCDLRQALVVGRRTKPALTYGVSVTEPTSASDPTPSVLERVRGNFGDGFVVPRALRRAEGCQGQEPEGRQTQREMMRQHCYLHVSGFRRRDTSHGAVQPVGDRAQGVVVE